MSPRGPGQVTADQALSRKVPQPGPELAADPSALQLQPGATPHRAPPGLTPPRPASYAGLFCLSMPDLSVVLEAMQRHHPWATLRITGTEWRHRGLQREAFERAARAAAIDTVTLNSAHSRPEEETEPWSLWRREPDLVRAVFVAGQQTVTAVWNGGTWWSWSPSQGRMTNSGDPHHEHGMGPGEGLVEPGKLLPFVDLEVQEETSLAGRPAYRLIARPLPPVWPRSGPHIELHFLGSGADEYRLTVDAERGLLLRTEARLEGLPFGVIEVSEVVYDQDLDGNVFRPVLGDTDPAPAV